MSRKKRLRFNYTSEYQEATADLLEEIRVTLKGVRADLGRIYRSLGSAGMNLENTASPPSSPDTTVDTATVRADPATVRVGIPRSWPPPRAAENEVNPGGSSTPQGAT